jgi:hypothetical protein
MCGGAAVKLHGLSASVDVPDAVGALARLRTAQARAPRNNIARYVMLFGADDEPRAALFDAELRFMTEMIEFDRIGMDYLLKAKLACPPPSPNMLEAVARLAPRESAAPRCFKLT